MNSQKKTNKIYRIVFNSDGFSWKSTLFYEEKDYADEVCSLMQSALHGTYKLHVSEEPRLKLLTND
jgi:hypothetical protein